MLNTNAKLNKPMFVRSFITTHLHAKRYTLRKFRKESRELCSAHVNGTNYAVCKYFALDVLNSRFDILFTDNQQQFFYVHSLAEWLIPFYCFCTGMLKSSKSTPTRRDIPSR